MKINIRANPYYTGTKSLDGNNYRLTVRWNRYTSKWYLDLKGISNSVEINNIALLGGKDLLAKYGYYELGQLWVLDNTGAYEDPDFDNVGTGSRFELEYTSRDA